MARIAGRAPVSQNLAELKTARRPPIAIQAKKWSFTRSLVEDAPSHAGVYAFWRGETLVHLGCAREGESIRDKLLAHLEHAHGGERPTHYSWELAAEPMRRAWELAMMLGKAQPAPG